MRRKKKDYFISPLEVPGGLSSRPSSQLLTLRFKDKFGREVQSFDFGEFKARPALAFGLAEAFRAVCFAQRPDSRKVAFKNVREWFRFLDECSVPVSNLEDISTELVRGYVQWLRSKDWTQKTKHAKYHTIKALLRWLRREHNLQNLELVRGAFPGAHSSSNPPEQLKKAELAAILRAARAEIKEIWEDFQKGQRALTDYVLPDDGKPDLNELGGLLTFIKSEYGGVIPPVAVLRQSGKNFLLRRIQKRGGGEQVCRYLHATNKSLLPYKIVIAAETFANADALHFFKRDCASPHPLLNTRTIVTWEKGRSSRPQRRSFDNRKSGSVPRLIEQVLALTELLLPHAHPAERDCLFLSRNSMSREHYSEGLVHLAPVGVKGELDAFCKRHDLRADDGKRLTFTLAMLRPTGLSLAHRELGRDIRATRRLANHVSLNTTVKYIESPEVEADNNLHISKLQAKWVHYISSRGTVDEVRHELDIDEINATAIIEGRNATASGFVCKNPLAGVAPGQRKGQLCTSWLGCFVCPNAVIPMEPKYLARIIQVNEHMLAARYKIHPRRWNLLYAPIVGIIERDIYPRFTDSSVFQEATELTKTLPPLPDLDSIATN